MQDEKSILKLNILKRNSENFTRIFKVILTLVISAPANQIKSLKQKKKKKTFILSRKRNVLVLCSGSLVISKVTVIKNFSGNAERNCK